MSDYISREAAIKAWSSYLYALDDGEPVYEDDLAAVLDYVPTADVRPVVRGEWIEEYSTDHYQAKCSACGESTLYGICYDLKGNAYYMDFCPKCGADMRETKGENT